MSEDCTDKPERNDREDQQRLHIGTQDACQQHIDEQHSNGEIPEQRPQLFCLIARLPIGDDAQAPITGFQGRDDFARDEGVDPARCRDRLVDIGGHGDDPLAVHPVDGQEAAGFLYLRRRTESDRPAAGQRNTEPREVAKAPAFALRKAHIDFDFLTIPLEALHFLTKIRTAQMPREIGDGKARRRSGRRQGEHDLALARLSGRVDLGHAVNLGKPGSQHLDIGCNGGAIGV